jgi:hypothetical protein
MALNLVVREYLKKMLMEAGSGMKVLLVDQDTVRTRPSLQLIALRPTLPLSLGAILQTLERPLLLLRAALLRGPWVVIAYG